MTSPAALVRQLLQPKILLLGAVLIGILYIGGFLTFFPGFSMRESQLTLLDGKEVQVFYSSLEGTGIASSTISITSKSTSTDSRVVSIRLIPSLEGVEKVGIRGSANINGGTGNLPSNAALFIIIENVDGNNAVELLRLGRHDGTKISNLFGGDAPGGVRDGFSLVDSNSQASLGNVGYDIPQAYRTSQYRLIVEMHVSSKVKDYYDKTWTTGTVTYKFDGIDITKTGGLIFEPPIIPPAPSLSALISVIKGWIKGILDAVPFLTITGTQSPVLGSTQTYQVALAAPYALDSAFADGTYSVRYCNTALVKADGTVLAETGFETCSDNYAKSFTVKLPSQAGQYAVIAVMAESKGTYDAGQWVFLPYEVIAKDALDITTKAPIPGASDIPIKPSGNFLTNLLRSLFGWLPFFK